jgi:hypothetical protein
MQPGCDRVIGQTSREACIVHNQRILREEEDIAAYSKSPHLNTMHQI